MVSAMFIDICLHNCSLDRKSSTYILYGTHKFASSYIALQFVHALYNFLKGLCHEMNIFFDGL
jgi:hypothetical protein